MFYHRLALALGCTVEEMLGRLTSRQITRWRAYYRLDPWGGKRLDMNAAMLASWIIHMAKAKGPAVDPDKLMLAFGEREQPRRQTSAQMAAALNAHAARSKAR